MKNGNKKQEDFTIELYDDLDVVIDGRIEVMNFKPERQAPACSDHDSPRFSDDGDPVEYDVSKVILTINGKEIEITGESADAIYDAVEIRLTRKLQNIAEATMIDDYENAMIDRYEERLLEKMEAR